MEAVTEPVTLITCGCHFYAKIIVFFMPVNFLFIFQQGLSYYCNSASFFCSIQRKILQTFNFVGFFFFLPLVGIYMVKWSREKMELNIYG